MQKSEQVKGEESPYLGRAASLKALGKSDWATCIRLTMELILKRYRDTWEEDESGIFNELEDGASEKMQRTNGWN